MSIPKVMGIETEYGIMLIGVDPSDPFLASDLLLRAYPQIGEASVPFIASYATQAGPSTSKPAPRSNSRRERTVTIYNETDLMLANGARFYIDHAHPEYSTPECLSPHLLVAADKAGERILAACQHQVNTSGTLPEGQSIQIYKNNTDYKNNSYGCHENYLLHTRLFTDLVYHRVHRLFRYLLPFLITRIIFCGAGKVGAENGGAPAGFQLSQRADFFETLIGPQTTYQRPLFNTRDEPHADPQRFRRLHVIIGDANMAEYSTYLKVGTTRLVLQMLEDDFLPADLTLCDPLQAIQTVSRDLTFNAALLLEGGQSMTAVQIQQIYIDKARQYLEQRESSEEEWKLWHAWEETIGVLPAQADKLAIRLDWAIKLRVLEHHLRSQGNTWEQVAAWQPIIEQSGQPSLARSMAQRAGLPWQDYEKQRELYFDLRRLDLSYHDIRYDTSQGAVGLFYRLQQQNVIERVVTDEEIQDMQVSPPPDTRAWLRGQCIMHFAHELDAADWSSLHPSHAASQHATRGPLLLADPLRYTEEELASAWPSLESFASVVGYCTSSKRNGGDEDEYADTENGTSSQT